MTTSSIGRGTMLGDRYRLDDLLSEDRGARFWRGTDTVLGRSVAVHALPSSDERAGAVQDAARASATVPEPHLLRVLDCSAGEETTWVVSEWGEGTSLDVMLQQGPLPAARAAWLTREVAQTISAAHGVGAAHGRLTPEAVLVTHAGAVKLIGFAVSAAIEGSEIQRELGRRRGYGDLDPAEVDVIDLAGILYAGLTGRWPGISRSALPDAPSDQRGPLRPRQVRAGVPRMLDTVCERVLRREAHEHVLPIETAQEVLAALSDHVGDMTSEPTSEDTVTLPPSSVARVRQADEPTTAITPIPPVATQDESALPPYEDSPDRPLFADGIRRPPEAATATATADTFGGGLGFAYEDEPEADPGPKRRGWRRAAASLAVVVVLAAVAYAFHIGRSHGHSATSPHSHSSAASTGSASVLTPVSVHDFDPEGNPPTENPDQVQYAVDDKPSTGWQTMTYRGNPDLGGLKSGVGLLLDLGSDHRVSAVRLALTGSPTSVSIYGTQPGVTTPPKDLSGLSKLGETVANGTSATVRLGQHSTTRYLVVWLTRLPAVADGYRGQIDQVTVLS